MPTTHAKGQCGRTAATCAAGYTRGAIRSLRSLYGPTADLGAVSIVAQFHNGCVMKVIRTHTTCFDARGVVTENPDRLNSNIYGHLQQGPVARWIYYGMLKVDLADGTVTEVQPSPTFRAEEMERLAQPEDEDAPRSPQAAAGKASLMRQDRQRR